MQAWVYFYYPTQPPFQCSFSYGKAAAAEELSAQSGLVALEEGDFKAAFRVRFGG
ncbi:MAG: hypothetical protein IKU32_09025 [Clostridia bacterium]|nr:hypothetical protein [Clostridia bacterium]